MGRKISGLSLAIGDLSGTGQPLILSFVSFALVFLFMKDEEERSSPRRGGHRALFFSFFLV